MSEDVGVAMLEELGIALGDHTQSTVISSVTEGAAPLPDPASLENPLVDDLGSPPVFRVQRMIFVSLLEQVMQVVPLKDLYPQLKNILIEVTADRLTLTGSDSTSHVTASTTTVRVDTPGRVLIGASRFAPVIRLAEGAEIEVRCQGATAHISSGAASWELRVASTQDYPPLPDVGDLAWHEVDRAAFLRALAGTRYAASKDENKDHLLQLDIAGGTVTATDDQRFAQTRGGLPEDFVLQLPVSGADLLEKMLARNDATQFRLADTQFHIVAEIGPVHAPDRAIIAHLMRPFPAEARTALTAPVAENRDLMTVSANSLIEVLRRAAPTSDEETGAVAIRVGSPSGGKATVATRNRYGDLSTEVIDVSFVVLGTETEASPRTVVVSHTHLRDALKAVLAASPLPDDGEGVGMAHILLGQPRSRSRPAYVLISDASRSVQAVLSQVRSDWIS